MKCKICELEIPEARLKALPGVKTCVEHSEVEKKVGVPISFGQGDHTYVELNIMEAEEHKEFQKLNRGRES